MKIFRVADVDTSIDKKVSVLRECCEGGRTKSTKCFVTARRRCTAAAIEHFIMRMSDVKRHISYIYARLSYIVVEHSII